MRRTFFSHATLGATAVAFLGACGGARHGGQTAAAAPAPPPVALRSPPAPRDDGHLPPLARPTHYRVALDIDPAQPRFSGTAVIEVEVAEPTAYLVLNARDMNVTSARARSSGRAIAATASARLAAGGVAPEELVLSFAQPLPGGPATLEIAYDAPFGGDLAGLYRVEEEGRWYAYTQFESTDARRAFPCFDEPGFKTPYDVSITAPSGLTALANAPEVATAAAAGGVVHTFATSPPLPSYLVAFAVGDFDIVEGRKEPFPIRVVATKGRAHLGTSALDVAAAIVDRLGDYFDMRYPYPKLDLVAVPDFAAGAMENPGLVTFRDALLLVDPRHATTSSRRAQAEVIAHEFAHQWFGDLVTMKWWNDIWLNEGFATWAEAKIVDQWRPTFGATLGQIANVEHVMDTDALSTARAVREPVRSTGEAMEAFDGLTYQKGAAVLRMIEGWLGPDVFQRGIQRYIHENAWKNAGADDLFKSLDFVSTQRVDELASAFLDHPGVPQVLTAFKCEGSGAGKLELRQSEWHPLGAEPDAERAKRSWTLPVCVDVDGQKSKSCFTLGADPIARNPGGRSCPSWVYPNAEQAGYYRFLVERDKLLALARAGKSLGVGERLGLVSNAWAGVRQGAIAPGVLLDFLPLFDGESNRYVVEAILDVLRGIDHALVDDASRGPFQKYVLARLAPRKKALGWWSRMDQGERHEEVDDDQALERRSVLFTLGELANDETTLTEAERYARAWLRSRENVSPDTAAVAVPLASIGAGEARLNELRDVIRAAATPEERVIAIRAMGYFDDPVVLRKAFDLALTDELKLSDWRYLFGAAAGHPPAVPVLLAWEKENWERLKERAPSSLGRSVVGLASAMCSPSDRDAARDFYNRATAGMAGVKRPLEEAVESATLCIALHDHGAADVARRLSGRPQPPVPAASPPVAGPPAPGGPSAREPSLVP